MIRAVEVQFKSLQFGLALMVWQKGVGTTVHTKFLAAMGGGA